MIALGALVLLVQQANVGIAAQVDRSRVTVGEEIQLTVRVESRPADPIRIDLGSLQGLSVVTSREVTAVDLTDPTGPVRVTTREVQLRAERAGDLVIGPVEVRLGSVTRLGDPIEIEVVAPRMVASGPSLGAGPAPLSPSALALLTRAPPPPRADEVALTVLLSRDSVFVGQQLDLVVAAWFPRELHARLRDKPVLLPPRLEGVWAYPQPSPGGVVSSRLVQGRWMDLFAAHQVVFPLTGGRIVIPPAMLEYVVAVSSSYFSREEKYSLAGDTAWVDVLPAPAAGRPRGDVGVVGQDLSVELDIRPRVTRAGEPLEVVATVRGVGNVALWPPPAFAWPAGFRAYDGPVTTDLARTDGVLGGAKRFEYLVVPDSGGRVTVDGLRYPYFDLKAGSYRSAQTAPVTLTVLAAGELRSPRALPPLLPTGSRPWASRLMGRVPPWTAALVVVLPPLLVWLTRRRRQVAALVRREISLGVLERDFVRTLEAHVPGAVERDPHRLAAALRAAGVDAPVAEHAARLRDRLRAERYGPAGMRDEAELEAEVREMLQVLGAVDRRRSLGRQRALRSSTVGAVLALLVSVTTASVQAQRAPSAEALYAAGALRAASDSFAARAEREPDMAGHWYNLGVTAYRAGADGRAVAALARAVRLEPRNTDIRRAIQMLQLDPTTRSLILPWWATPQELLGAAAVAWALGWALVAAERRRAAARRWAVVALALGLVSGALGAREISRRSRRLAVVGEPGAALRVAPYGPASAAHTADAGEAVLILRELGPWWLVRRDGDRGWVLKGEVLPL